MDSTINVMPYRTTAEHGVHTKEQQDDRPKRFPAEKRSARKAAPTRFAITRQDKVDDEGGGKEDTPRKNEVIGVRVDTAVRGQQFRDGIERTARDYPLRTVVEANRSKDEVSQKSLIEVDKVEYVIDHVVAEVEFLRLQFPRR